MPFIDQYNWNGVGFPRTTKNDPPIALNVFYIDDNDKQTNQCYISRHNNIREIKILLL